MKTLLLFLLTGISLLFIVTGEKTTVKAPRQQITNCGVSFRDTLDSLTTIALLPGLGSWKHPVTTKSRDAQKYFNQGLSLIYAFNHGEAIRSFQQATNLDRECAMGYWGIAYALGPNINMPMDKTNENMAYDAIQKAKQLVEKVSRRDAAYINALSLRYGNQEKQDRASMDSAYIRAMKKLSLTSSDDADAQTLYADALMNTFPWQYWEKDGTFKPKALEVLNVLENVLRKVPDHVGANHLLIHLVEGSTDPAKGLKSAAYLEYMMSKAGHIVHMPSHIYIRTGNFDRAAQTNIKAIKIDEEAYGKTIPKSTYAMYYGHNIHFLYFTANMLGQRKLSLETAIKLSSRVPEEELEANPYFQELSVVPYHVMIRFGMWDEMLKQEKPSDKLPYMRAIRVFGRGLAQIRNGNIQQARAEWRILDSLSKLEALDSIYTSLDPVSKTVGIASSLMKAEVLIAGGDTETGLKTLHEAVIQEDNLIYNEPPTWPLPVRQFLGAALLNSKRYREAEKVYREDLQRHPENGWSLYGLQKALKAQSKESEAKQVKLKFEKVWSGADTKIAASRF